jgi:hypothetical protein
MTDRLRDRAARGELDTLDDLLAEQLKNPGFAAAYEDAGARFELHQQLVAAREAAGLSRTEVAARMEVKTRRVDDFEDGRTDPYFSFLQRYARAVGKHLTTTLETS